MAIDKKEFFKYNIITRVILFFKIIYKKRRIIYKKSKKNYLTKI